MQKQMQQHFFSKEFIELDFVPTFFSLVNKLGFGRKQQND